MLNKQTDKKINKNSRSNLNWVKRWTSQKLELQWGTGSEWHLICQLVMYCWSNFMYAYRGAGQQEGRSDLLSLSRGTICTSTWLWANVVLVFSTGWIGSLGRWGYNLSSLWPYGSVFSIAGKEYIAVKPLVTLQLVQSVLL